MDLSKLSDKELFNLEAKLNQDYQAGREEANPVRRGLTNALQGLTFGFGDELAGGVAGALEFLRGGDPASAYRGVRDQVRGTADQYQQDFPIGGPVTQGAAGMALTPFLSSGKAVGTVNQMLQAGRSGAITGAVSGAGDSTAETPLGVLADSATSAVVGGALGPATTGAAKVLGAVGNQVGQRVNRFAPRYAQEKVAEALARDAANPEAVVAKTARRMQRLGSEATVADAGGQNTRQLLDTVATLPGKTKQAVEQVIHNRQATRADRLMENANRILSVNGRNFTDTVDSLIETRARNAGPLYQALQDVKVRLDAETVDLLNRAKGVDAEARRNFLRETGIEMPPLHTFKEGQYLPFNLLDSLKKTLYDAAQSEKKNLKNHAAATLNDVRTKLIDKLDEQSPKIGGKSVYKMALDEFASKSELIDAAEIGRRAMRGDINDLQGAIRGMSASEIDAFRIGAVEALREKTGTESGQTALLKMWKEPATQERLRVVFGDGYRKFAAAVAAERNLKPLEQVGRGSQTAARQAGMADIDLNAASNAAASVATGNPLGMIGGVMNLARSVRTPEPVRDEMGALLLSRNPNDVRALQDVMRRVNSARAQQAAASGLLGGQVGASASGLLSGR